MIRALTYDGRIALRDMTKADAAFDRQLFDEDRGAQFAPLGLNGPLLAMLLDQQFRAQQRGYKTAFPDAENSVIMHAGQSVGRLTTAFRTRHDSPSLHVVEVLLSAAARGRGIGSAVMRHLDDVALARGAARLSLSVLVSNAGARQLYERVGYRAIDDDGVRIAMTKDLAIASCTVATPTCAS